MTDGNLERFCIETLTKEKAQELGHIAWIEEKDPIVAIRKMMAVLKAKPYNCVIWANADPDPNWRQATDFSMDSDDYYKKVPGKLRTYGRKYKTQRQAMSNIREAFSKVSGDPVLMAIKRQMQRRLNALFAASGNTFRVHFELRARETSQEPYAHIDLNGKGKKILRFLDLVNGRNTYLFSNKDAARKPTPEHLRGAYSGRKKSWGLAAKKRITAYEVPQNSFVLVSGDDCLWQPILHTEPFLPADKPVEARSLAVYNCQLIQP